MDEAISINRISSQRQEEGYSLPQQAKLNREIAEKHNRKITKEFYIIESAKNSEKRDDFKEAINYLKDHPSIKYCYIEKPDRLSRNFRDIVLTYELMNDYNLTFIFSRDGLVLNKHSNSGEKINFDIKAVLAKNYVDNLSDEVKKGQRGMLEEGRWPGGGAPTGYKKENKLLVPDEPRANFVVKSFELYASGSYSLRSLKIKLDAEGFRSIYGKPLTKSNYSNILINPIYYGVMKWNGKLYEGKHTPLIDKQLFDKVQSMLARTKNGELIPVYSKHDVTYRGNLQCGECKSKITAEERTKINKGNGKVHHWIYYHCTHFKPCSQTGSVREEVIEQQIVETLNRLSLGPNTTEWLKNKLKESHQDEIEFRDNTVKSLRENLDRVTRRLDKVYDDKLDEIIDEETYHKKREEYLLDKADLETRIKEHSIADEKYVDFGSLILDVANRAGEIYQYKNPDQKRYLLNLVFSNLSLQDKKLQFSFNTIFQAVLNYQNSKNELRDLDSNQDR